MSNLNEIVVFVIENVLIIFFITYRTRYIQYNPIEEIKKIYSFIMWFYNTGSASVASKILGEDNIRDIIKSNKEGIILHVPISKESYEVYIPYNREISEVEIGEITDKITNILELYSQKIEIYSIVIVALLIFPSLLLLTLTILIDIHIVFLIPLAELATIQLILVKVRWMRRR